MSGTNENGQNRVISGEVDKEPSCPLCKIAGDEVIAEFPRWKLARTKTMKGHKERLMLYHKEHLKTLDEQSIGEAYILLSKIGSKFFSYADKWAIFEPVYATVPDHWHRVASDLDESALDYQQILKTPRTIVDNKEGTIARANPGEETPLPSSNTQ
jgi:hypothetical protein